MSFQKSESTKKMLTQSELSAPTESFRSDLISQTAGEIETLLLQKATHYGAAGGFYENNQNGDYQHAIGEAKLKLSEFQKETSKTKRNRLLLKALAWIYLIYETETRLESQ